MFLSEKTTKYTLRELIFAGINFRCFRGFSAKSRIFEPAKYNFCQTYRKIWKTPRKMKEICPKKGKTAKINSCEMRFFQIFLRPPKLVPAKISSLKVRKKSEQNLQIRQFPAFLAGKKFFSKIGLGHVMSITNTHLCAKNRKN